MIYDFIKAKQTKMSLKPEQVFNKEFLEKRFFYRNGELYYKDNSQRVAGSINKLGYCQIHIKGKTYLAHRLIWFMFYSTLPETIDHINRNRSDNRIENLKAATKAENLRNLSVKARNTSGIPGVSRRGANGKWRGQVCLNGKTYSAGSFSNKEDCSKAVLLLRQKLHGEFCSIGELPEAWEQYVVVPKRPRRVFAAY